MSNRLRRRAYTRSYKPMERKGKRRRWRSEVKTGALVSVSAEARVREAKAGRSYPSGPGGPGLEGGSLWLLPPENGGNNGPI